MSIKTILILFAIYLTAMPQGFSGEIKVSQYKIKYDMPKNKYFALLLSKRLPIIHRELYKLTGLKCQEHINIHIYHESSFIKEFKVSDNNFSFFDTANSIKIILKNNRLISAVHPFELVIKKKILFALFRQNNIPENFWFEDSFFEIMLYEKYHFGAIALPNLNTKAHFRFLREDIKSWKDWVKKPSVIQVSSVKDSLLKVSNTKFLILNDWLKYAKKKDATLEKWIKKKIYLLRKKTSWQVFLSNNFMEEKMLALEKQRALFSFTMQTFNYPNDKRIEDSSKYIFKYSLRMLLQNQTDLCKSLYKKINFYPAESSYFSELGIHLTKEDKEENPLWLEYYLINQNKKTPLDFSQSKDIKIMIAQTINLPEPEFSLKGENLELYRSIQFTLFKGDKALSKVLIDRILQSNKKSLELLNLYWSVGILLGDKKSLLHFKSNAQLYQSSLWPCLKSFLKD